MILVRPKVVNRPVVLIGWLMLLHDMLLLLLYLELLHLLKGQLRKLVCELLLTNQLLLL